MAGVVPSRISVVWTSLHVGTVPFIHVNLKPAVAAEVTVLLVDTLSAAVGFRQTSAFYQARPSRNVAPSSHKNAGDIFSVELRVSHGSD